MIFTVNTYSKAVNIHLALTALSPVVVFIVAFDPDHKHTDYVFREKLVDQNSCVDLRLPFSPNKTVVYVYDAINADAQSFDVVDIKATPLVPQKHLAVDRKTKQFIDFAVKFATIQGYANTGTYRDRNRQFKIELMPDIVQNGKVVKTPYRIHRQTGEIQCSKKQCLNLTVSSRICLLLHEYSHNFLSADPDSEFEADQHALEIYTALTLPNVEGLYAFARIFHKNDESDRRLAQILAYLEENDRAVLTSVWENIQNDIMAL